MRLWRRRSPVLPVAHDAVQVSPLTALVRAFWSDTGGGAGWGGLGYGQMSERIGTVDRCLQLNSQAVSSMPLRYRHVDSVQGFEPAWISNPDPAWYPNGIVFAVFAAVWSVYAKGDAFLYVTSRYETGYPRTWTVLDAETMRVEDGGGFRAYQSNQVELDPDDVLQVSRDPRGGLTGRGALEAYWANVASSYEAETYAAQVYAASGVNRVALRSSRRLTSEQASDIQSQWIAAVASSMGAPAIIPPDLELLDALSVSPKDLMLLESRDWDARQIAAAFGVPAILLNIPLTGGLTYQNPAALYDLWYRSELLPCALKLQEALSRWLPRGHWCAFDPTVLLKPAYDEAVKVYSQALKDGAVTVDEYRAAVFDLPPLAAGDQAAVYYEESGVHGTEPDPALADPELHTEAA